MSSLTHQLADTPPFFTMQRSRGDQKGELISVLLTVAPLPGLNIGRNALPLSREQVAQWERQWNAPVRKIELPRGAGGLYSRAEREAAGTTARLLTQDEPLPQTMYRVEARAGAPLLVTVPLGLKKD